VPAHAEAPALAPLLTTLELRGYPAGTMPPAFSGRALDARPLALADLHGRVVVLNFWATWCLECRPEMPGLERLHRRFASRGLAIVGVNAREEPESVRRYAAELGLSFPLVLDPGGVINRTYGVIGLPTTFVVARDGRAVALGVGPRDWGGQAAASLIQALLDEPPARPRP
jgi:peroxiredoxin